MNFEIIENISDVDLYNLYDDILISYYCACSGSGISGFCWPEKCVPNQLYDTTSGIDPGYSVVCDSRCKELSSSWAGSAWSGVSCYWPICRR